MVTRLLLIAALLCCLAAYPQFIPMRSAAFKAVSTSYIINEGFEEADTLGALGSSGDGYDSSLVAAETGTINNDYATSPAPISGSYSAMLAASDVSSRAIRWNIPASSEVWARAQFNDSTLPATTTGSIFTFYNDTNAVIADVRLGSGTSSSLRIYNGTTGLFTTAYVTNGVTYYIWLHARPADGFAEVAFHPTSTRPVSGSPFYTNVTGTITANITRVLVRSDMNVADDIIWDNLLVSTNGWPGE